MATARQWFLSNYKQDANKLYTSKYYTPQESWPKTHVWWLQIPPSAFTDKEYTHVNLLCQKQPGFHDYHYLKVPTTFLNENIEKFDKIGEKISLYLSANPASLFIEERGQGRLDFSSFLVVNSDN